MDKEEVMKIVNEAMDVKFIAFKGEVQTDIKDAVTAGFTNLDTTMKSMLNKHDQDRRTQMGKEVERVFNEYKANDNSGDVKTEPKTDGNETNELLKQLVARLNGEDPKKNDKKTPKKSEIDIEAEKENWYTSMKNQRDIRKANLLTKVIKITGTITAEDELEIVQHLDDSPEDFDAFVKDFSESLNAKKDAAIKEVNNKAAIDNTENSPEPRKINITDDSGKVIESLTEDQILSKIEEANVKGDDATSQRYALMLGDD